MARGIDSTLLIKKQPDVNVVPTFGDTAADAHTVIPFTSESLRAQVTQVASQMLRRSAQRQRKNTKMGTIDVSGSVSLEITNNALHNLLPLLFTAVTNNTAPVVDANNKPTVYDRKYTITSAPKQYATIMVDDGEVVRGFANMVNTQFSISSSVNQLGQMTTDWMGTHFAIGSAGQAFGNGVTGNLVTPGRTYALPATEYGLFFDTARVEVGTTVNGVTTTFEIPVTDFNLSVNFNANGDRYRLGSRFRRDIPTGVADVTGSFTMDANLIPAGATGGLNAKEWAYQSVLNSTYLALRVSFIDTVNTVDGNASNGNNDSKLEIILPYIYIDTPAWNISGPDIISGAINFTSFADGVDGIVLNHKYAIDKAIPAN